MLLEVLPFRFRIFGSVFGTTPFTNRTQLTLLPPASYGSSSYSLYYYHYYYYYYYYYQAVILVERLIIPARFDVFAAVLLRICVFRDMMRCLMVNGSRLFEGS
jgi:hypothetical protein